MVRRVKFFWFLGGGEVFFLLSFWILVKRDGVIYKGIFENT